MGDSCSKYIVNLDEIAILIENMNILNLDGLSDEIRSSLEEILDLLNKLMVVGSTNFKVIDMSKHIPAIVNNFIIQKNIEHDGYITCICFSQTGWKSEDQITFAVNNKIIIDRIYTKELGQHKAFPVGIAVEAGDVLTIKYHNHSGNSKMFYCDINYTY